MSYPPQPVDKQYGDWFPAIPVRPVPKPPGNQVVPESALAMQPGSSGGASPGTTAETLSLPKKIEFGALRVWVSGAGRDSVGYDDGPDFDAKAHDAELLDSDDDEETFCFAPGTDEKRLTIRWQLYGRQHLKSAKLELFCRGHATPIWEHHWGDAWGKKKAEITALPVNQALSGKHTSFCELPFTQVAPDKALKLKNAAGTEVVAFPKGLLTVARSPYQLRLTVSGCTAAGAPPDGDQFAYPMTAWTYLHVAVHAFAFSFGPKEWLSDQRPDIDPAFRADIVGDRGKGDYGREGAVLETLRQRTIESGQPDPVMGPSSHHRVALPCNHNTKRAEKTAFDVSYAAMWGHGPRLPLRARATLRTVDGGFTSAHAADVLLGAGVLWDWAEEDKDRWQKAFAAPSLDDGKVSREFLGQILDGYGPKLLPRGSRNAPESAGGKHGSKQPVFPPQAKAGTGKGDLPNVVTALRQRTWAVVSEFGADGTTGVICQPSRLPGDVYRVRACLFDESLDHDGVIAPDRTASGSPGCFEVFRRIDVHHLVVGTLPLQGKPLDLATLRSTLVSRAAEQVSLEVQVTTEQLGGVDYDRLLKRALELAPADPKVRGDFDRFGLELPRILLPGTGAPGAALVRVTSRADFLRQIETLFKTGAVRFAKTAGWPDEQRYEALLGKKNNSPGWQLHLGRSFGPDPVCCVITASGSRPFEHGETVEGVATKKTHVLALATPAHSCHRVKRTFTNTTAHNKSVLVKFPGAVTATLTFQRSTFSTSVGSSLSTTHLADLRTAFKQAAEAFDDSEVFAIVIEGHQGTTKSSRSRITHIENAIDTLVAEGLIIQRSELHEDYLASCKWSSPMGWAAAAFESEGVFQIVMQGLARAWAEEKKCLEGVIVMHASRRTTFGDHATDRVGTKTIERDGRKEQRDYTDFPTGGYVGGALEPLDLALVYLITPDPAGASFAPNLKLKEPWAIFLHEIGHAFSLPHAPLTRKGQPGAPSVMERQHVKDSPCLMSYDSESNQFCGLCMTRLRGWKWEQFRNTTTRKLTLEFRPGSPDLLFAEDATTEAGRRARLQVLGLFNRPLELDEDLYFKTEYDEAWAFSWKLALQLFPGLAADPGGVLEQELKQFLFESGQVPADKKQGRLRVPGGYTPYYGNMDLALRHGDACTLYTPPDRKELAFKMNAAPADVQAMFLAQNPALGAFPLEIVVTDELGFPRSGVEVIIECVRPGPLAPMTETSTGAPVGGGTSFVDAAGALAPHEVVRKYLGERITAHQPSAQNDPQGRNAHWDLGGKRAMQPASDVRTPREGIRNLFSPVDALAGADPTAVCEPARRSPTADPLPFAVSALTDDDGIARVIFTPSVIGGDSYRLRAFVVDPADATVDCGATTTGDFAIWRTLRVGGLFQMENVADATGLSPALVQQRAIKKLADADLFRPLPVLNLRRTIGLELAKAYVEVLFAPEALTPQRLDAAFWRRFDQELAWLLSVTQPLLESRFVSMGHAGFQLELTPQGDGRTFEGTFPVPPRRGGVSITPASGAMACYSFVTDYDENLLPTATQTAFTVPKPKEKLFGLEGGKWEPSKNALVATYDLEFESGGVDLTTNKVSITFKRAPKVLPPAVTDDSKKFLAAVTAITGLTLTNAESTASGVLLYTKLLHHSTTKAWDLEVHRRSNPSPATLVAKATGLKAGQKGAIATPQNGSGLTVTFDLAAELPQDPNKPTKPPGPPASVGTANIVTGACFIFARYFTEKDVDLEALLEKPVQSPWLFNVVSGPEYNRRARPGYLPAPPETPPELTDFQSLVGADRNFALTDSLFLRTAASAIHPEGNRISYYPGLLFIQAAYLHPYVGGLGGKGTGNTAFLFNPVSQPDNPLMAHYLALHEAGHCLFGIHANPEDGFKKSYHDPHSPKFTCVMGPPLLDPAGDQVGLGSFCGKCNATLRGLLTLEEPLLSSGSTDKPDLKAGKSREIWKKQATRPVIPVALALPPVDDTTPPPDVVPVPVPTVPAPVVPGATYLLLSAPDAANGESGQYPATFGADAKPLVLIGADRQAVQAALADATALPLDPVLDLLVLNQGHGDHGLFSDARWDDDELRDHLVQPLLDRGLTARVIVLDFCLSASLLPVFLPLCAPDGRIVSNLYSLSTLVVDRDTWAAIEPELTTRDAPGLWAKLEARMKDIAGHETGHANEEPIRRQDTELEIGQFLQTTPAARDFVSVVRYLHRIFDLFDDHEAAVNKNTAAAGDLAAIYDGLLAVKNSPHAAAAEKAVLAALPTTKAACNPAAYTTIRDALKARMRTVATEARFGVASTEDLTTRTLFGHEGVPGNLGHIVWGQQARILQKTPGLTICPSSFTIYDRAAAQKLLDATLTGAPLDPRIEQNLRTVEYEAPDDVPRILATWSHDPEVAIAAVTGQVKFLQNG